MSKRQHVSTLFGGVEIEMGDGTIRRYGPGGVMLAKDTPDEVISRG